MNFLQLNNLPVAYRVLALALVAITILALDAAFFNSALANNVDQVFQKAETKTNELTGLAKGRIAVAICALVIAVTAILAFMSRISHMVAVKICAAAFVIGSCVEIANWLMT